MSSAANHRKRSHWSEAMHRQESTKHFMHSISKMNRKVSFLDRYSSALKKIIAKMKPKKERGDGGRDN